MINSIFPFRLTAIAFTLFLWVGCDTSNPDWEADTDSPEYLHQTLQQVTDVIVHDIFSPPVASRIYAYSSIAAYEALVPHYPKYKSLQGQLDGLENVPQPEAGKDYCYPLAAVKAMIVTGKQLIFSEDKMDAYEAGFLKKIEAVNMPKDVYDRSLAYGEAVGKHILEWADKDNYKETRSLPKFAFNEDPARWKPTPPDYMDAIEPHWDKIRTFVLDSAKQFVPPPPTPFDVKNKNSQFYKEVMEVYNALGTEKKEKKERVAIAQFWDCNPYVSQHSGHVMFATKKITPGGHWMGIAQLACKQTKADIMKSAEAYALTSIALADAFISCWDEKYRSVAIRPETVINTYIDQEWLPVLQTPPFPEYTSGHSVISAAAAIALTRVFGENFAFNDTVEEQYGLPSRQFSSFMEASREAAISRLYGGIHYRPACFVGIDQGKKVGKLIVDRVKTE